MKNPVINIIRQIRQSLSLKLGLGILLMAIPIFVVSLGILYVESRDNVKKEATERASSVVNTTMQRIDRYMNTVETATNINDWEVTEYMNPDSVLACSNYVVSMNSYIDGCSVSMEPNIFPKFGKYFSVYTVREPDTITTVIEEEYDYFDKIWYKMPRMLGEPCWVVYYDEGDSLELTLDGMIASYSKPLYNAKKDFIGVISTDLSLLRLSKIIATEKPYPDSYFVMTGEEGRYFLHPDTAKLFTHTIFSDADPKENADIFALGHEMTTGKQGNMRVIIDGEPCLVSYQPVADTKWSLALVCPERNILQNYNRLNYIVAPLIFIGLLLILLFSSMSITHAILPLNNFVSRIRRIEEGNYDEAIPRSQRHTVVCRLQNSLSIMQESLKQHLNDIQQMNAEASQRNEELARASELAKEADRQKSLFIQNVSHQIRTPLNIIMGFAQVLRESHGLLPKEEKKSITDMMSHNAILLQRMVMMLFDSSAKGITEEIYTKKNKIVYCNELARDSIALIKEHHPDITIAFKTSLPDSAFIYTSDIYLSRSVNELLYNAIKYSDGQNISLSVSEKGTMVRFVIEDTGTGIPEGDATRLFEPFIKANDLSDGLGLGLPLAKRHITHLNGNLILDTSYRKGCRFIIELPQAK